MRRKLVIFVPRGTSAGILRSQIVNRFKSVDRDIFVVSHTPLQAVDEFIRLEGFWATVKACKGAQIYVRSVFDFVSAFMYSKLCSARPEIIFDVRGLISEEFRMTRGPGLKLLIIQLLERFALQNADYVWTVSEALAAHLWRKYNIRCDAVTPCCVPESYVVKRMPRMSADRLTFVYVGSLSAWQNFEEVCRLVKSLEGGARFIVVTEDIEKAAAYLQALDVDAEIRSGGWEIVVTALDEADFGFLLRDSSLVNRTASPVKFVEYLARGVVPIITPDVGDYSGNFGSYCVVCEIGASKLDDKVLRSRLTPSNLEALHEVAMSLTWESRGG